MPSSFAQKEKISLKSDGRFGPAKLGHEHIIVFEKKFFSDQKIE